MGTLADEERTFLLNATGLPSDSTLSDLRYAYFKGINDGSLSSGIPKDEADLIYVIKTGIPVNQIYTRGSDGALLGIGHDRGATADSIARRTTGGQLRVGTGVLPDSAVTKAQLDSLTSRVAALENPTP